MKYSIYQLKPKFQQLLAPALSLLTAMRVMPNHITLLTMFLSVAYGLLLVFFRAQLWLWYVFPLFMLMRMALNAIDGMLAIRNHQKTQLGSLLNEICDQVSDAALYLPFALLPIVFAPLLIIVALMALLAEFAGVSAALIGGKRRFDGPMGKSDRAFAFSILAILVLAGVSAIAVNGLLVVVGILLVWTIVNRLKQALKLAKNVGQSIP